MYFFLPVFVWALQPEPLFLPFSLLSLGFFSPCGSHSNNRHMTQAWPIRAFHSLVTVIGAGLGMWPKSLQWNCPRAFAVTMKKETFSPYWGRWETGTSAWSCWSFCSLIKSLSKNKVRWCFVSWYSQPEATYLGLFSHISQEFPIFAQPLWDGFLLLATERDITNSVSQEPGAALGPETRWWQSRLCLLLRVHSPGKSSLPPGGWPCLWSPHRLPHKPALWVLPAIKSCRFWKLSHANLSLTEEQDIELTFPQMLDFRFQILNISHGSLNFV